MTGMPTMSIDFEMNPKTSREAVALFSTENWYRYGLNDLVTATTMIIAAIRRRTAELEFERHADTDTIIGIRNTMR